MSGNLIKSFLVFACIMFNALDVVAQRFNAGLIGCVNFAQLDGDSLAGYNQLGFNLGGKVEINLKGKWKSSIELLLSEKGS